MEDYKKRSRKTKLVPRQYLDSDDENIAQMQNEIEETIAQINPQSILRKLEPNCSSQPLEFSVKIEVEELNDIKEDKIENQNDKEIETSTDLNIKILSVRSINELETPSKQKHYYYPIEEEELKREFDILSETTTSEVDKLLEIHMKNRFGRGHVYTAENNLDRLLQLHLRKWRAWHEVFPHLRDAPGMYICYVCDKGWWHFSEFREHVKIHGNLNYGVETPLHEFRITAFNNNTMKCKNVEIASDCWKCGKDVSVHQKAEYTCVGCKVALYSCTVLSLHEGNCNEYKELVQLAGIDVSTMYQCPVCPYKQWDRERVVQHLSSRHSVRSDLPIDWSTKNCSKCNLCCNDYRTHECPKRPFTYTCQYCGMHFKLKLAFNLHLENSVKDVSCRICGMHLLRSCMEVEHLIIHTSHYIVMFKCILCVESLYFLDFASITMHRNNIHGDIEAKDPFFEKVIVPKVLPKRSKRIKIEAESNASDELPSRSSDGNCEGIASNLGVSDTTLNEEIILNAIKGSNQDSAYHGRQDFIDKELGIKITVIDKTIMQQMINETKSISKQTDKNVSTSMEISDVVDKINNIVNPLINTNDAPTIPEIKIKEEKPDEEENTEEIIEELVIDDMNVIKQELLDTSELIKDEYVEDVQDYDAVSSNTAQSIDEIDIKEEPLSNYGTDEEVEFSLPVQKRRKRKKKGLPTIAELKLVTRRYKCTKCANTSASIRRYLQHFTNHNYKESSCPSCFKQFPHTQTLLNHFNTHIKGSFVMIHAIRDKRRPSESNYQCRKCKMVLSLKDAFGHWESHLEIHDIIPEDRDYFVNMDHKPLLKDMLASEFKKPVDEGKTKNSAKRSDDGSTVRRKRQNAERVRAHRERRKDLAILQRPDNSRSNDQKRVRLCLICDKRFERRNDCKRHYIEHLLSDAYEERDRLGCLVCQLCGRGYQKGDGYKRHMRDHACLPIYKCEICDKTFSDSSNFCKHKKVHNMSVLVCDICKKKFSNKNYLIKHIKLHQVIAPINCGSCDKVFYSESAYKRHLKRNQTRSKCPVCCIYFTSLKDKWDHMWLEHKERKYEADCPVCKKSFRKYVEVKNHLREEHNEREYLYYKSRLRHPGKPRKVKEFIIL